MGGCVHCRSVIPLVKSLLHVLSRNYRNLPILEVRYRRSSQGNTPRSSPECSVRDDMEYRRV